MKKFTISNSEENRKWCYDNLDSRDYEPNEDLITIFYYNEMQKEDILNAICSL